MDIVKVEKRLLADNNLYSGWGYFENDVFVPSGYGLKYFKDMKAYGRIIWDIS